MSFVFFSRAGFSFRDEENEGGLQVRSYGDLGGALESNTNKNPHKVL